MEVAFSIVGIFGIGMLIGGIVLTVITMARMRSGKISLPGWGKVLLSIAMIAMVLILVLGMLPPDVIKIETPFENEYTHIVSPSIGIETTAAK